MAFNKVFNQEEVARLKKLIQEGDQVLYEVDALNTGLRETVKAIAEELEESPNGVRMILTKAGVYVKKSPASGGSKTGTSGGSGGGRVSKAAAQESLIAAITDAGQEVDEDVISKLTGKAAQYRLQTLHVAGLRRAEE